MELYFAPLEGITGREYRLAHQRWFGGVDKYYAPFLSPTQDHVFTPKEKRNVFPEYNPGVPLVPQLLTKNPDDFTWAADELFAMGYGEVNLNLGCPSGTVVAKGKGAGMLADPENLNEFLYEIYRKASMYIEPILNPIRQKLYGWFPSLRNLPVDLSPLALWLLLDIAGEVVRILR